ncbi:MAG: CGNR zinc finger domain-containing protein [Candidatus Binataceae bacterium]
MGAGYQRDAVGESLDTSMVAPNQALCLDFANTLSWRGGEPAESLHGFEELKRWCLEVAILSPPGAQRLQEWSARYPVKSARLLVDALDLREVIYRVFHARASACAPSDRDLELLNRALDRAPGRGTLVRHGDKFGWRLTPRPIGAPGLLAPALWSAGDLLVGPQAARVRQCGNQQCLWLFLDDSKNGSRRWCSMRYCGNRAKAQRHYQRSKGHAPTAE